MSEVRLMGQNSHVSGNSSGTQLGWAPPRAPLTPHRLAKIANALGISTPSPAASSSSAPFLSSTFSGGSPPPSNTDLPWRGATPPTASAHNIVSFASSSQTKFFLHVMPPLHLSHEFDTSDTSDYVPPPPTASGYHTQSRRGTLVALQPSLHAQLIAIAKEYALPSTVGLILYLVTASPQSRQGSPMPFATPASGNEDAEEPGPRLSEEIWRHIWTRVLKAEREEVLSRGPTPSPFGLKLGPDPSGHSNLRPLITHMRTETHQPLTYPITPTSTASSLSDLLSHSKSTPLSSSSLSHSEPDTPDTSRSSDHEASGIDLPGLNSPSIIPILAKVEFDIDRRRAAWYEPWLRGRRMTFARRAESRQSNRAYSQSRSRGEGDAGGKRAPFDLKLVERMQNSGSVLSFSTSLSSKEEGSNGEYVLSDSADEEVEGDETRHMTDVYHHDSLVDVFGTDADTWADIHAESQGSQREVNPNVVELALDASSLTALPEPELLGDEVNEVDDAEEVRDIMRRMSKPQLVVSIPPPLDTRKQISSPTVTSARKPIPPPLVLAPDKTSIGLHAESSSMASSAGGGDSPYLSYAADGGMSITDEIGDDDKLSLDVEQEYMQLRSPAEEKRVGAVFEDLNLGLDLGDEGEEYDENDPNDRRRSQYLMRAKLDEIERTLAQFSPRQLKTSDLDEDLTITHARSKSLLALHARSTSKLSIDQTSNIPARGNPNDHANASEKSWPAVPYSYIASTSQSSGALSSPQIAVNGVSTSVPKSFVPPLLSASPNSVSAETKFRKRDLESSIYRPPLPPSIVQQSDMASDSPIPLSPDPFGRYPSFHESESQPTRTYWDPVTRQITNIPVESRPSLSSVDEDSVASTTPSSRFSADSSNFSTDAEASNAKASAPLVSVKTFKRLWRRSKSSSVSNSQQPSTPNTGQTSFQVSAPPVLSLQDQLGPPPPPQRGLPPVPTATLSRPLSSRPPSPSISPSTEKIGIRKSILKTWKSVSSGTASSSIPSEPRRDTERPVSNETIKPRRPSILDTEIPPTPKLAEQYLPSNLALTGSGIFERSESTDPSKTGQSSNFSTSSQDTAIPSRTPSQTSSFQSPGSVSPARSVQSAASRYSEVDGSFESAQYELVTPPGVYPNLPYPYQTLDQD